MDRANARIVKTDPDRGRLVTIETLFGWKREWPSPAETAPPGLAGDRIEIRDETHETMAFRGVYEGLKRLFRDYAPNLVRDAKGFAALPALEKRYAELSEAYGYRVDIPRQVLLISATRYAAQQMGAEAVELVARAVALYGESPATRRGLAEAEAAVEKGSDSRLAEWAKLPAPGAEAIKPFLGRWERRDNGALWSITFELAAGAGRARNEVTPPSGEVFNLEIAFVKVLDGKTVQWGERNGRGPGVTVFTAVLKNDNALEGTAEAVGFIISRPPQGFSYQRARRP